MMMAEEAEKEDSAALAALAEPPEVAGAGAGAAEK